MLNREAFLSGAGTTLPREKVKAFGDEVWVQGLTASERDEFEASCMEPDGSTNVRGMRSRLITYCVVDEDGKRLFQPTDALKIGNLPAVQIVRVSDVAMRLSGLLKEDLKELEKNSVRGPLDSPSST